MGRLTHVALAAAVVVLVLVLLRSVKDSDVSKRARSADRPPDVDKAPRSEQLPTPNKAPLRIDPSRTSLPSVTRAAEADASVFPLMLPDTPEMAKKLADTNSTKIRYIYDYMLGLYAYVDRCTDSTIRSGTIFYFLDWRYDDDGVGHADAYRLNQEKPPEGIPDPEVDLFGKCVQEYFTAHAIYYVGPTTWAMQTEFPLTEDRIVKLARGEL